MELAGGVPPYTDYQQCVPSFLQRGVERLDANSWRTTSCCMAEVLGTGTPDIGTWSSPRRPPTWDKASDANVCRSSASRVLEPASLILLGSGLIGVARTMRKRRKSA